MRRLAVFCAVALHAASLDGAEAARDPQGWRDLRFGMTFDEAVVALGDLAHKRQTAEEQEAANQLLYSHVDVSVIEATARDILVDAEQRNLELAADVQSDAKTLKNSLRSRTWVISSTPSNKTRVAGTLQGIKPSDQQNTVTIKLGNGKVLDAPQHWLDDRSVKLVRATLDAARRIRRYSDKQAKSRFQKDDSFRIKTPAELLIREVTEHDLAFEPELTFTPQLSSIILKKYLKENPLDAFATASKSIMSAFGAEDEATLSENGRRMVWRFPTTTLTLSYEVSTAMVPIYNRAASAATGFTSLSETTRHLIKLEYLAAELGKASDSLCNDESLVPGDSLRSVSGQHVLRLTHDGNLVLNQNGLQTPKWTSGTEGSNAVRLKFAGDGNIVLVTAEGKTVWETHTSGSGDLKLLMQDDGNLVLYKDKTCLWATGTETR